ncbi:30S ribosomal protein S20 [Anaerohalosphaera lusitana]|uniref:Small ribosomal subunit protein bS20 n=1 Tax=Anaerohalosphaera lusitana TaxID=1936003 RepID=A0A1U9NHI6_9BACT|nr:30S ribosomal protein S20 [Anaerohalosphaera lusitana]AQT67381.1 30S ribosomal protein S20 [Anaerohalosphaera lusitana]
MAHSLSAKKRVRQNAKRNARNRGRKGALRKQIKTFEVLVKEGDAAKAQEQYKLVEKLLDKLSCTPTLHKNTASRMKSRLAKQLNTLAS